MIVNFQVPATGGGDPPAPVLLAPGWATKESITITDWHVPRTVQDSKPARASVSTPNDRGNREVFITFFVNRKFDTEEDALTFMATHPKTLDCSGADTPSGTLLFTSETIAEFGYQLNAAVCLDVRYAPSGVLVKTTWEFKGSETAITEEE